MNFSPVFGVKIFEDLLDNRRFILKTDHMNLTYLNVILTAKVQRWKLYMQDKDFYLCHVPGNELHQFVPDALSRLCDNHMPVKESEKLALCRAYKLVEGRAFLRHSLLEGRERHRRAR